MSGKIRYNICKAASTVPDIQEAAHKWRFLDKSLKMSSLSLCQLVLLSSQSQASSWLERITPDLLPATVSSKSGHWNSVLDSSVSSKGHRESL